MHLYCYMYCSDGTAKISDVGMAKIMAREYSGVTGNVGTLAWVRAWGTGLPRMQFSPALNLLLAGAQLAPRFWREGTMQHSIITGAAVCRA